METEIDEGIKNNNVYKINCSNCNVTYLGQRRRYLITNVISIVIKISD